MPSFRILDLPLELLRRIASTLDGFAIVVACSERSRDDERRALEFGYFDGKSARFPANYARRKRNNLFLHSLGRRPSVLGTPCMDPKEK